MATKEFTVERKQTLVNEDAWFYRFYIWMYPDFWTQKITFCRLFWGLTVLMPFAVFINCNMYFFIALAKGTWWAFLRFYDLVNWIADSWVLDPIKKWRVRRAPIIEAKRTERERKRKEAQERERSLKLARLERDEAHEKEVRIQRDIEWEVTYDERMERRRWKDYETAHIINDRMIREAEEKRRRAALLAADEAKRAARRARWERAFRMAEGAGNAVVSLAQKSWPLVKIPFYALGIALIAGAGLLLALFVYFMLKILWVIIEGVALGLAAAGGGLGWLLVTCGSWVANNIGYIGGIIIAIALLIGLGVVLVKGSVSIAKSKRTHKFGNFLAEGLFRIIYYCIVKPLRAVGLPVKWGAVVTGRGAKKAGGKVGSGAVKAADTGVGFISAMVMGVKSIKYKTCPIITVVDEEGNVIDEKQRKAKPLPGFDIS